MHFACILWAVSRDTLPRMMNKKAQDTTKPTPRGAGLEKVEVWLPVGCKRRLEAIAALENRSTNKQAVHYLKTGMDGASLAEIARKVDTLEAMLTEVIRRLDSK